MNDDLISREATLNALKGVISRSGLYGVSIEVILAHIPPAEVESVEEYKAKLLKKMFPLGIPKIPMDWNYSIPARAVYEAIMNVK